MQATNIFQFNNVNFTFILLIDSMDPYTLFDEMSMIYAIVFYNYHEQFADEFVDNMYLILKYFKAIPGFNPNMWA